VKTLLSRIKENLRADGVLATYVKSIAIQITSADLLPDVAVTMIPFIGIAPVTSTESFVSTQEKAEVHTVKIQIVNKFDVKEVSILGDSVKKGIKEIIDDVENVIRSKFFPSGGVNYLSKPSEITGVTYTTSPYGDQFYVFVASITLVCEKRIQVSV